MEYKVTLKDVYGDQVTDMCIVKGGTILIFGASYTVVDFRPPTGGELYLSTDLLVERYRTTSNFKVPRLILKKISIIPKETTFTEKASVEEVYGGDVPIPDGYEFMGFVSCNKSIVDIKSMGVTHYLSIEDDSSNIVRPISLMPVVGFIILLRELK